GGVGPPISSGSGPLGEDEGWGQVLSRLSTDRPGRRNPQQNGSKRTRNVGADAVARHERALLGRSGPGRSRRRGNSLLGSRPDGVSTRIGARKNVLFLRFHRRPAAGTLLNREGD